MHVLFPKAETMGSIWKVEIPAPECLTIPGFHEARPDVQTYLA